MRRGATTAITRLPAQRESGGGGREGGGAGDIMFDLLRRHPPMPMETPLTIRVVEGRVVSTTRAQATAVLRLVGASAGGGASIQYSTHCNWAE